MKNSALGFKRIVDIIGSTPFFWAIVALFVLQAMWIALSGRYPMAFDEDFHLGIIKLYANHPNPFWRGHVAGGDAFGAVARDPSYLYHYLMSFPYKLINWMTNDLKSQVIILRSLNIAFFAGGLFIYRRLLLKTKASVAIVHLSMLILILIPVTSLLAAQINYDNLFFPLIGLALLSVLKLVKSSTAKLLDVPMLFILIAICLSASLVKYAFLPIFITILIYTSVFIYQKYDGLKQLRHAILGGIKIISQPLLIGLVGINLILGGLFVERYGINLIRYHTPVADCAEVLDYNHCKSYGPWIRDYKLKLHKTNQNLTALSYDYEWIRGMWFRSFFAVAGPSTDFQTRGPLTLPGLGAVVFTFIGLGAFVVSATRIWRRYDKSALWLMASVSGVYIAVLWLEEFRMYIETGWPVAVNGRYLVPVLPFLILMAALAVNELTIGRQKLQLIFAGLVIICLSFGGGALTYILRSNDAWYWQDSSATKSINHSIKNTIGPITPGYNRPTQYVR